MVEMDIKTNEREKIELSISTKGIYTWTIKALLSEDADNKDELALDRLQNINNQMKVRFKNEVNTVDI